MLESAIDYGEISQEVPGRNFLYYEKNPNFRIIATQNPITGNFIHKREELSEKFLQRFQIIEFPSLEIEELKLIALGLAKSRNFKDKNIINIITDFHHKWINDKSSLASPQGFTIRELNITINAISKKKLMIPAISAIRCFYSQRYEKKEREKIENILSNYSNFYQKEIIPEIEYNIPFCYHSESIKRVFYYSKISIENGRHLLLVGNQGNGLTQIGKWIAEAFSINKDNSFCFIFTPETSVSDLIGKYIPNKKYEIGSNIIEWKDGPLLEAIKNGYSGVFDNINLAQSKVIERLNCILEPRNIEKQNFFYVPENNKETSVSINNHFIFISTCENKYLSQLSPAFLNRLNIIRVDDQLENIEKDQLIKFINAIFEQEKIKISIPNQLIESIYQIQMNKLFKVSQLAKFSKITLRLYVRFQSINIDELINYSLKLVEDESNIEPPSIIQNEFKKLIENKNLNTSNDEKFYFKNSKKLMQMMVNLYACMIGRIPICLVGSTGIGKTSMAKAFSYLVNENPHIFYSFNMETQIDDLYGTYSFSHGLPILIKGPLTQAIENGNIFIADELNLAEKSILESIAIVLESSTEGIKVLIPGIGETINYNKNFFFIACQNDLQMRGRNKLPEIIQKRVKVFEYPFLSQDDIEISCKDIAENELEKNLIPENFPKNISNFMNKINKNNFPEIGIWSMRNIRKLFRRLYNQQLSENNYKNVIPEIQILIFILGGVIPNKRYEIFMKIRYLIMECFSPNKENESLIDECFNKKNRT